MVYLRELPHCGRAGMARNARTRPLAAISVILLVTFSVAEAGGHYPRDKDYDDYPYPQPHPPPPHPAPEPGCPLGSYRSQKTMECEPCPRGTYAVRVNMRASCAACPSGRTTLREGSLDIKQCVCQPGFGRANGDSETCVRCPQGTYSFGDAFDDCYECPFPKTTSFSGATSDKDCVCPGGGGSGPDCDQCPQNMILMSNGICGCAPGTGGTTCNQCLPGFYSTGGKPDNPRPVCKPCGLHFTSPPGAIGPAYCECEAGYGAGHPHDSMGEFTCDVCPIGTYNPGPGMGGDRHIASLDDYGYQKKRRLPRATQCRPCNSGNPHGGFTTIDVGAKSVQQCVCAPGHGGPQCDPCQAGTFSPGGAGAICQSCPGEGAGYTTVPYIAATSASSCVCIPGYGMSDKGLCRICPANTYSEGISKEDCKPCPFGHTSAPGSCGKNECVPASQPCPVGQIAPPGAVSSDQCVCLPGHGGTGNKDAPCAPCPAGTWSPGVDTQPCIPCGFGFTSPVAATSPHECYRKAQSCPIGQWAPHDAVSADQCACYPGFGGGSKESDPCDICPVGTFSPGFSHDRCVPCGFGYTSHIGAKQERDCYPVDACPSGTEVPHGEAGASTKECMCKPGSGSPNGEAPCRVCPVASYSPGGSMEDCKPCPFGYTSRPGSRGREECEPIPQACPVGQIALAGAVSASQCVCLPGHGGGRTPSDPCTPCPPGTWASGDNTQPCVPCGFGYTSPEAATCPEECYPINACPAGTQYPDTAKGAVPVSIEQCVCKPGFGSSTGKGICSLCPVGAFSDGGSMEDCKPCPFGYTSSPGACGMHECRPMVQACPIGQWAPFGAVSAAECRCYKGFGGGDKPTDACNICPAGTYSANVGTERCIPCGFGFTSPEGACGPEECYPVDQCPAGTEPTPQTLDYGGPNSALECVCKPGYGAVVGEGGCHLCPAGSYGKGGSMEDCVPCPFGYTSAPGTTSWRGCVPAAQECPVGQLAPLGAVSKDECGCLPGHGGGATPYDACSLCPVGTWSEGGDTNPCTPCDFGYTSPEGATCAAECYPVNACPPGTTMPKYGASSAKECVCLPGYGTESQEGGCSICPSGYYRDGYARGPCVPCPFGMTSPAGAVLSECVPMAQPCPVGQIVDPQDEPVSVSDCHCLPGFGGGETPQSACTVCSVGSYSPGIGTQPCFPCPFGYTSPIGSLTPAACYEIEACPGGTLPAMENPSSTAECACIPGFGSHTGRIGDPCFWCPPDTFNEGFNWDGCKECTEGSWAPAGSPECYPVGEAPTGTGRNFNRTAGGWKGRAGSGQKTPTPTVPVSPSGFYKEWQAPAVVPMAFMSAPQGLYAVQPMAVTPAPGVHQQMAQMQLAPQQMGQMQMQNSAGFVAPGLQQQQVQQRAPRRAGFGAQEQQLQQQQVVAAPVAAPAAGAYELQMPAMPMAGNAPQEWAMPYSMPTDMTVVPGGYNSYGPNRLGQALTEMQGTSPNPAFMSEPALPQQQQQQVLAQQHYSPQQRPAYQQMQMQQQQQQQALELMQSLQPPQQQPMPMQMPLQVQQQQQQMPAEPQWAVSEEEQAEQENLVQQQQARERQRKRRQQPLLSTPTKAALPTDNKDPAQPGVTQQKPVSVPVDRPAPVAAKTEQPTVVPAAPAAAPAAAPIQQQQQQQVGSKAAPAVVVPAQSKPAAEATPAQQKQEQKQPAPNAAAPLQKQPAPAPAAAKPEQKAPVGSVAPEQTQPTPVPAPNRSAPVDQKKPAGQQKPTPAAAEQKQPAPAAAAPVQKQSAPTSAAAAPVEKQPAAGAVPGDKQSTHGVAPADKQQSAPAAAIPVQQKPAAADPVAGSPNQQKPAAQASTQATAPSDSSSSSILARPLAAVRRVVRRYVSSSQPAQLVANDELTARAVKVASTGLADGADGVSEDGKLPALS